MLRTLPNAHVIKCSEFVSIVCVCVTCLGESSMPKYVGLDLSHMSFENGMVEGEQ